MKKYVLKHLNVDHLKNTNQYLKYYADINFKHYVYNIDEATHFEKYKTAYAMKRKFKHPELWKVVVVKECQK